MYKKKIEKAAKTNGAAQSLTAEVRLEQRPKKDCLKKLAGKKRAGNLGRNYGSYSNFCWPILSKALKYGHL